MLLILTQSTGEFERFRGRGIALAAPEVPLEARAALLEIGREHGFFNVATFSSEDILRALDQGLIGNLDLLAMNRHEAATLAGLHAEECAAKTIVESAAALLIVALPAAARLNNRRPGGKLDLRRARVDPPSGDSG